MCYTPNIPVDFFTILQGEQHKILPVRPRMPAHCFAQSLVISRLATLREFVLTAELHPDRNTEGNDINDGESELRLADKIE